MEYGVTGHSDAEAVAKFFSELHGGEGAVVTNCGVSAISTVLLAFAQGHNSAILMPDNRYYPMDRTLQFINKINPTIEGYKYPSRADRGQLAAVFEEAVRAGKEVKMIYLEAPGSQTFEIPDLEGIIAFAKAHDIPVVMDNTWGSHELLKPILQLGVDIVLQATTKYEMGYADGPSGVLIARTKKLYNLLEETSRAFGLGAVPNALCRQLLERVTSTRERLDQHYRTAQTLIRWLEGKSFVGDILCPFWNKSPDYERYQKYFTAENDNDRGNGLFTIALQRDIKEEQVVNFLNGLLLCRKGESWGHHITLAQWATPGRSIDELPKGHLIRLTTGLEDGDDVWKDIKRSAEMHLMAA